MAPRKRPQPVNLDTFVTQLKADPSKVSFFDLPPELRNTVYVLVFASTGGVLLSRQPYHRTIAPKSSTLLRVNKQIHNEFMHAAWLLADIHTTSLDFNFRHIVAFLNRHEDEELRALPSMHLPHRRAIFVEIIPSPQDTMRTGVPMYLDRWLNRIEHPTKKGTRVWYEYWGRPGFTEYRLRSWRTYVRGTSGRKREELDRIIAAVS
ncbi:hypothetical protein LTR91_022977 [Friedmanniomyces endolithicus]|uniref:Uncharacterized protein n=1 Tax=Friedmanniomyces endolithicus TaxID=329885 RepID=A0AAN6H786_9PEZI|nr:hypothetical protein LTR94_016360 [Friedmanniomyces endolithicus]KAK0772507.1 hypothetical protein LTR59_015646 [Friedmanniomyces endolithicus]KAK0783838.1 hypothetical protein LTR38_012853 [Friedmanniomyces endolithicus]KAK0784907.1 hypothetical protein LTR75_013696 [Friedmanniomyces endolithicus]KAK0859408.1 hypothetical protein LTS02_009219 [Friedmanniomyces endolithicus]